MLCSSVQSHSRFELVVNSLALSGLSEQVIHV